MSLKIYLSASLVNGALNERVTAALEQAGHDVVLPQRFCPTDRPHETFPESIFRRCIEGMASCDVGLLMLDCYGRDSSWECGWFEGHGKPMFGFLRGSLRFLEDWMIKGGLAGVITTDSDLLRLVQQDDILRNRKTIAIASVQDLGPVLQEHVSV